MIETSIALPAVQFAEAQLSVTVDVTTNALHGQPFPLRVGISNQTALLQQIKFAVSDAQGFLIAGLLLHRFYRLWILSELSAALTLLEKSHGL